MTAVGYSAARLKGDAVARTLRDVALLIGEPATEPVTLETGGELVPGLGLRDEAAALVARARDLDQGLFKIIVLGEFKNGKSTLLNSMLGSKTLPAKAAPATAIITVLVYGDGERVAIYENDAAEPRMIDWEAFVREFQLSREDQETLQEQGRLDRFRHVQYAQVECRHPICASGVKLIDSPGLGEHISRTRVATNFLKQSQAVIFVLNATRVLGQEEREFIDTVLGRGRLSHVFFLVNRMDQVDEDEVAEIRAWVGSALTPHFLDENGVFDRDFYSRRVFFVEARTALEARMVRPIDESRLNASGVPRLERELERFLTGGEKVAAMLQSTAQTLLPVVKQARHRITQQKTALDQPLADLERRHVEAERRLDGLQSRKRGIERTILLFAEMIKQKVYADLRAFIDEMHERWPEDSRQLIDLDRAVSIKSLVAAYAQREAREQMAAAIGEQVQHYLQVKFMEWSQRIPSAIQSDVEKMVAEVEAQVDDFQLELDEIAGVFSGAGSASSASRQGRPSADLMNLALTLGDISGMTDAIMHPADWSSTIGRMAQQVVAVLMVGTFITGGNFLIALVLVEAVNLGLHEHELKKRIRMTLGERLHESLQGQVAERQAFVYDAVEHRFRQFARNMTDVIQRQIDEVRAEQERILRQKRDEHFSVEGEKRRLDEVGDRLVQLVGELSEAAFGRRLDLTEMS